MIVRIIRDGNESLGVIIGKVYEAYVIDYYGNVIIAGHGWIVSPLSYEIVEQSS